MLDRDRILAKLDELHGYLGELRQIVPESYARYVESVEKRRACERLLQIAIECVIDVCALFVSGLRLGLPAEEDDLIDKLEEAGLISSDWARDIWGISVHSSRGFCMPSRRMGADPLREPRLGDLTVSGAACASRLLHTLPERVVLDVARTVTARSDL